MPPRERSSRSIMFFFLFLTISPAMASDCVGGLDKPRLPCCVMVVASVSMGNGDPVPCLCLVVKEPAFLATALNINSVFSMYPVCRSVLPVGPYSSDPCKGSNS